MLCSLLAELNSFHLDRRDLWNN